MEYKIKDFRTIDNLDLKGKRVLVSSDLNTEIINDQATESERMAFCIKTIEYLSEKKAKVVVLAHQGQPGKKDFVSLRNHAKILNKYVKTKFVEDITGKIAVNSIVNLKDGEVLLLENVRFEKDEFYPEKKDNVLIDILARLFDFYVNDNFSTSHRNETSIVSFPKYLPSLIGKMTEKEIKGLEKIKARDCLYILAGAKPGDLMLLINNKNILTGGLFGFLCLRAAGYNLGAYNKVVDKYNKLIPALKNRLKLPGIKIPIDFAYNYFGKRKEANLKDLPIKYDLLDIGKKTIEEYKKEIRRAKNIYVKGTIGLTEIKDFDLGTKEIFKAITNSNAYSIMGGGSISNSLKKLNINKSKIDYVSLSGGALLYYLTGRKLPGLEAIKKFSEKK